MSRNYRRLCRAVSNGDMELVNHLLKVEVADPNPSERAYTTPLAIACRNHNLDIVRLLITNPLHPADPNTTYYKVFDRERKQNIKDFGNEASPFFLAVSSQSIELVNLLLTESRVSVNTNAVCSGITPIAIPLRNENLQLMELLLKFGADPNMHMPVLEHYGVDVLSHQWTILNQALGSRHTLKYLRFWLQYAYNKLGERNECWHVELVKRALCTGSESCVLLLLRWGMYTCPKAQKPATEYQGSEWYAKRTTFFIAANGGKIQCIKALVELNPWCLQESWLVNRYIPNALQKLPHLQAELIAARKQPRPLDVLCRATIFKQLGYNPIAKAEKLLLPRKLMNFIQFNNLPGFNIEM